MAVLDFNRRVRSARRSHDAMTLGGHGPHTIGLDPMGTETLSGANRLAVIASGKSLWPFVGIGLVGILVASALLFWCYRYFSVESLLVQSKVSSTVAAQATLEPLQNDIADFLRQTTAMPAQPLAESVKNALADLVISAAASRARIYDSGGTIVFSTHPADIGHRESASGQLAETLAGKPSTIASYRDAFSLFDSRSSPSNEAVAQLPLRHDRAGPVVGVFEVGTDLTALVAIQEHTQVLVAGSVLVILVALYAAFLVGLRQIGSNLARQQDNLRQNADLLPAMFRRSMGAEEIAKQRIAAELHEHVAQTLAAVKLNVEGAAASVRRGDRDAGPLLDAMVSPLQTSIREVREAAEALHPAALNDLGLTATMDSLYRDASAKRSDIAINFRVELKDDDVPASIQPVIYRAVEDALVAAVGNGNLHQLRMLVGIEGNDVIFRLRDDASSGDIDDPGHPYARLRERTLLSGGRFGCRNNSWGGVVIRTAWRRQ